MKNSYRLLTKEELEEGGIYLDNCNGVEMPNGKRVVWFSKSKIPPWERYKRQKNNPLHQKWRIEVFKRDNYICQRCMQYGGQLEAHHIKSFIKYKKLRYDINNGITLCKECHKKIHKEGIEWQIRK